MELFEAEGFHPRTDLGQNFLIDLNLVRYLVDQADLGPHDVVLEVGAGTGGLTELLAEKAAAVISIEVDQRMYRLATDVTESRSNVTLLNCDALHNKNRLAAPLLDAVVERLDEDPRRRLKLVSNLPYNIATPIVSNLVASDLPWKRMVVTIQAELAHRMSARPQTSSYGALSVWLQSQCYVKTLKSLAPTVFWPRPRVNSAIVRLVPCNRYRRQLADRRFLHDFLRRLFHQRRKLLRSVLVGMYRKQLKKPEVDALLRTLEFSEHARAEEIDVPRLIQLSNRVQQAIAAGTVEADAS